MASQQLKAPYPLCWPGGQARAAERRPRACPSSFARAYQRTLGALRLLCAQRPVVSTAVPLTGSYGAPRAGLAEGVTDPGAAVYFSLGGRHYAVCADAHDRVGDNLSVVAELLEALAGMALTTREEHLAGWSCAPDPWQAAEERERAERRTASADGRAKARRPLNAVPPLSRPWYAVLGVAPGVSRQEADRAFWRLARLTHPDAGGTAAAFIELCAARDEARMRLR